ncbi:aminotransferase class I/II-fold pyridoxal phosphate-dependent enzyme [Bifidobacterium sp. MA2]|uniref:Aminotransferase class I/II-fold pyridoxal phosphate-dependent enzyme n=1 Tax=Bifidobacterium santillanense TaxID=2809028 RepID=A0ABS5UN27_9BIFI|nr:aminotransferase class I/II-fold pyridoxal phosphate-dependent enzyme [Bifidobacterium santillanense]MBT1172316.1 aminotransferase class I/II-fold pyridoxal phosphate-dependent enzyme [Bifidobacterium santillanense]
MGKGDPSFIGNLISRRATALPPNPFAEADARVAASIRAGRHVIDLSKGNPDGTPPAFMQDALAHAAHDPSYFRYPPFDGIPEYLAAIRDWYGERYDVALDERTDLLAVAGASVGISTVIDALIDEGDLVVAVDPYYPQYEGSTAVAKGAFATIPADPAHGFLPDLDAVDPALWDRAKLLILNYPNNPTGAVATPEFYERVVALAHEHRFAVVNDFAYAGIEFGDEPSPSILETPGAADVAVELGSLSKMFMVAGWRGGWIAGNADILAASKAVHRQTTVLAPSVIQRAGAVALNGDLRSVARLAATYGHRAQVLSDGLCEDGLDVVEVHGGLFLWARVPEGYGTSDEFTTWLLEHAGVAVIPGSCFGPHSDGYVRFSLLRPEPDLYEAVSHIGRVLKS